MVKKYFCLEICLLIICCWAVLCVLCYISYCSMTLSFFLHLFNMCGTCKLLLTLCFLTNINNNLKVLHKKSTQCHLIIWDIPSTTQPNHIINRQIDFKAYLLFDISLHHLAFFSHWNNIHIYILQKNKVIPTLHWR